MTDIKINPKELRGYLQQSYNDRIINTIDQMIKLFRHLDKKHNESTEAGTISGQAMLYELFQQGLFPLDLYINIHKAVINPNLPYNITIIE